MAEIVMDLSEIPADLLEFFEPVNGANKRDVFTLSTKPFSGSHFATFPPDLIEPMILAGCPVGGLVLDPFMGAATTAIVAQKLGRNYIGSELNPEYVEMARQRIQRQTLPLPLFDTPIPQAVTP